MITQTHYMIDGNAARGCDHNWQAESRPTAGGRNLIERVCEQCGGSEKWLSLSRPRRR